MAVTVFAQGVFADQVVLVTGGGTGIGLATARLLGTLGARVAILHTPKKGRIVIEYRGNAKAIGVDAKTRTIKLEVEDVKADVLNVVPPQRAGDIAVQAYFSAAACSGSCDYILPVFRAGLFGLSFGGFAGCTRWSHACYLNCRLSGRIRGI